MNGHLKEFEGIYGVDTPTSIIYHKGRERVNGIYKKYELLTTHCGRRTFISNAIIFGIAQKL